MKKTLTASSLMLLFLLSLTSPLISTLHHSEAVSMAGRSTSCTGDVCINEVIPNPNGLDDANYPGGEWLELHNNGTSDVDLTGWKVTNTASQTLDFDSNTIVGYETGNSSTWTISAGEYVVIARNGKSNFYMTNSGMSMTLVDNNNNNLHQATWGTAASGKSYQQDPSSATGNWVQTNNPTPGQVNTATVSSNLIPGDIIITEVMANSWPSNDNASWPEGEWVEILNTGNGDIDLTGYTIEDAAGNVLTLDTSHLVNASQSMLISPGQHRIVAVNATSGYGVLNNGVETLTLKWPNGSRSQEVSWSSTVQGFSLMVSTQPNAPWTYSPYPTPEGMNPLPMELMARQVGDVHMTEILSNATNDGAAFPDGEWIELHNTGAGSIDLMGWSIMDGMGNLTFLDPGTLVFNSTQGSTVIDPDGRRLVQFTSYTELWDNYNHVFLRDMNGQVVDTADYTTDYGEDMALVRGSDPTDSWTPAAWKTPGQPEPGSMPSSTTLRFSEILPDAVGSDSQMWPMGEWIELYNYGTSDVDVAGWKLQAASRSLTLHEFNMPLQDTTVVKAGEAVLIALNGTSSFYLKHTSSDSIGLVDAGGSAVDTIAWSETVEGESLVAPNSTHAGVGPNASNAIGNWILSAWPTPGEVNPVWAAYSGSTQLVITEVLPYCNDDSIEPTEDWVEVHNVGSTPLNISRWSVLSADGDRRFIRHDSLWSEGNLTPKVLLDAGERAVFLMDEYILSGLGDAFDVLHPDGIVIDSAAWTIVTDCQTLTADEDSTSDWKHTLWPTPGEAEPIPSDFATKDDLRFTRFMASASTSISSDMEFIEITNQGNDLAMLNGWTLRTMTGVENSYNATIVDLMIQPGTAIILANDADAVRVYEDGTVVDLDAVLDRNFYLPNSGAALQLLDTTGAPADTLVYGNGPVSVAGWNGIALAEPLSNLDNLIYLRGNGCGDTPDTDTVVDWHEQWSRLGGSTFCFDTSVTANGVITPLIAPEHGLADLLAWIDSATTSLHVHMYLLHEANLVQAMIDAQNRGVDVNVVLDYGDNWWKQYDLDTQRGMATELLAAGVDVKWFGDTGENPYAYIHSKVAVKDEQSVWIGSGNWRSSSHPAPGEPGNRDWGVLVDDAGLATMVLNHLAFDENDARGHVTPVVAGDAPTGWVMPTPEAIVGTTATGIDGDFEAHLLVCPDNCIDELVKMLDGAEEEILLSLQYLDTDWSWGWGENPILEALEDAAARGVRLRMILNGAFLDEDIQSAVDRFNEEWNFTMGYDTASIVMSSDDKVTKLHNKGVIVDGEHVLISSINWGDSALVRNREMGLLLSSPAVASVYVDSWYEDWNRLDNSTDTDQDRLLDKWEVEHGFDRAKRSVAGDVLDESLLDADQDGLNNFAEQLHGGDPNNADTDGDCITDDLEVAWAQATALNDSVVDVNPRDALTMLDADGDGENDSSVLGCDLAGIDIQPVDNNDDDAQTSTDDDGDGVLNEADDCPDTPAGVATDAKGCSSQQRTELVEDSTESTAGNSAQSFFLILMISALILSGGAYVILRGMRSDAEDVKDAISEAEFADISPTSVETEGWQQPVLNASGTGVTPAMLAQIPGWTAEMVEEYLKQGWTFDQLVMYYQEQVAQHEQ
tara:strand:+ start:159 stop:5024 length:4866 start_codon:yes stop_codon:yes gene_type:complete